MDSGRQANDVFREILCDLEIIHSSLMQPTLSLLGVDALERVAGYLGMMGKSISILPVSQLEQIRKLLERQQETMNVARTLLVSWQQSLQGKGIVEGYSTKLANTPARILASG